jgi:hypothetical protein
MKGRWVLIFALIAGPAQAQYSGYVPHPNLAHPSPTESEDIPFYCRSGSFAYVPCDEEGNIYRYHRRGTPHYRQYGW